MHPTNSDNNTTGLKTSLIQQNRYLVFRISCGVSNRFVSAITGICLSKILFPGNDVHQTFPCRIMISVRKWGRSAASVPSWYCPQIRTFFSNMHGGAGCWKASSSMLSIFFAAYLAPPRVSVEDEYQSCILRIKHRSKKRHTAAVTGKSALRILMSCSEN